MPPPAPARLALSFRQTSHEGQLVDWIHETGRLHAQGWLGDHQRRGLYQYPPAWLHDAIKGHGHYLHRTASATYLPVNLPSPQLHFARGQGRDIIGLVYRATHAGRGCTGWHAGLMGKLIQLCKNE